MFPQPQYLGSKYKHLDWIKQYIPKNIRICADAFAGSQSVAYLFKQLGYNVYTNDFMEYSNQIGKSLIENKNQILTNTDIDLLFSENTDKVKFCLIESLYTNLFFNETDARFLDNFRSHIGDLNEYKQNLALTIILRAMTRKVPLGHFAHTKTMEYSSNTDRIKRNKSLINPIKDIFLELADEYNQAVFDNKQNNKSYCLDVLDFVRNLENVDLIYFDPPYCDSHADYQSFYHVLETYVNYWHDKTFTNKTKRYSPKKYSGFDLKSDIIQSFKQLFEYSNKIPYWLISYNDKSYPTKDVLIDLIRQYKDVEIVDKMYYNSVGGKGSTKGSRELLFICKPKGSNV